MDIFFFAVAITAALLLPRSRALVVIVAAWVFSFVMVGWGPAGDDTAHPDRLGFWVPWVVVLAIGLVVAFGIRALRDRRRTTA